MLVVCAACGFSPGQALGPDGKPIDAPPDTAVTPSAAQRMEVVAGAGRLTAGSMTIDVEVGQAVPTKLATAGTITISGAQVVSP